MKRLMFALGFASMLVAGCSDDEAPAGPTPNPTARVVVAAAASAPSLTSVDGAVWNGITETAIAVPNTSTPKPYIGSAASVANTVYVKAARFSDSLYIRARWADASISNEKDRYYVAIDNTSPVTWTRHTIDGFKEDHLMLFFDSLANGASDVWHWRLLTTGYGFMAEGQTFSNGVFTSDALANTNIVPSRENPVFGGSVDQPTWVHKDGSAYKANVLYKEDQDSWLNHTNDANYVIGDWISGWIVDTTARRQSAAARDSRWDIASVFSHSAGEYTVVLCRPMATGYPDDIDLVAFGDSISVVVGVMDNLDDVSSTLGQKAFSRPFWLILQ